MEWFVFRKRHNPIISPLVRYFTPYSRKTTGFELGAFYDVVDHGWQRTVIEKKAYDKAGNYLLKKSLSDRNFLARSIKESRKIAHKWHKFCMKEMSAAALSTASDEELCARMKEFYRYYEEFSCVNVAPWMYMPDKLFELVKEKTKRQFRDGEAEIVIGKLSMPQQMSFVQEYERGFLKLLLKAKGPLKKSRQLASEVRKLSAKYFWMPFEYIGPTVYDEKHIINELAKESSMPAKEIIKKIKAIDSHTLQVKEEQSSLIKKYKLHKSLPLFSRMRELATLQDEKKAFTTEAHFYLGQMFGEMHKRTNVEIADYYYLTEEEAMQTLQGKRFDAELRKRKELVIILIKFRKLIIWSGRDALPVAKRLSIPLPSLERNKDVKEIRGQVASRGYAKGIVKVVTKIADIGKVNKGDILVTFSTTPNFVPAMKKAAAIITDEGGITSHAAIVSREMKKPCIVGTLDATAKLKDGDIVEVDADRGIIRILR